MEFNLLMMVTKQPAESDMISQGAVWPYDPITWDHNTWVTTLLRAKQMKSLESNETITSNQLRIFVIYMWEITCSLHNNFQLSEIVSGVWEMRNFKKFDWLFGILCNNCYSSIWHVNCDSYSSSVAVSLVWDDWKWITSYKIPPCQIHRWLVVWNFGFTPKQTKIQEASS